ncbi:MAG: Rossmann-like and DUF2520 domain-containing protein [Flavobacterium sp.]|uniref:Rossmann-like and DUF2520 domain-containing protein n=1 Tax=Flavobacterium sp. TaxID=239 RepID=UPI003264A613
MIRVVIIGSGNVAQHLIKAFAKSDIVEITQVFSRKKESLTNLLDSSKITSNLNALIDADLYIISVSDNAIAEVSHQLNIENKLVVHTSGSVDIIDLNDKNRKGVFYPLQTFSKNAAISFDIIPICLEAENKEDYKLLETVAKSISDKVFNINSNQRKALHVSAVFVNNFVNHLYKIGNDICNDNNIPFEILQPLITETANKIASLSPNEAQTGPAKRNDTQTINTHLQFLTDENQKEIYKILTKSIIDNGKKL